MMFKIVICLVYFGFDGSFKRFYKPLFTINRHQKAIRPPPITAH